MKKLMALVLALSLTLCVCFAATAEGTETYALTEETFTNDYGPIWYYMYYDVAEEGLFDLHPTPMWGDNWQFSADPDADQVYHSICEWDGIQAMPGTWIGEPIDIVVVFKAPKAGTIEIAPMEFVVKDDGVEHVPCLVQIVKVNGETSERLLPADGEWAETPVTTEAIEATVEEGTQIMFIVRAGADDSPAVSVMPVISYK